MVSSKLRSVIIPVNLQRGHTLTIGTLTICHGQLVLRIQGPLARHGQVMQHVPK
jgi:hypothetical protein